MGAYRSPISSFSTTELLEEIIRRKNADEGPPVQKWCDDCAHFVTLLGAGESYNPCMKGHAMSFRMPDDLDDEWGFFRRVCGDRCARGDPIREDSSSVKRAIRNGSKTIIKGYPKSIKRPPKEP